jgi:hypothetical protein
MLVKPGRSLSRAKSVPVLKLFDLDDEESAQLEAECIEQNPKRAEASKEQQQRSVTSTGTRRPEKESTTQAVPTARRSMMRRQFSMPAIRTTSKNPLSNKSTTQAVPTPRRSMMTRQSSMPSIHARGHFEAHWDVPPSSRESPRKPASCSKKKDELSMSWHPESSSKKQKKLILPYKHFSPVGRSLGNP